MRSPPAKNAFGGLLMLGAAALSTGTVYTVAFYLERTPAAADPRPVAPAVPSWKIGQSFEAGGIEGAYTEQGLLVKAIDGAGAGLGLQTGDVVQSIGGQPVLDGLQLRILSPGSSLWVLRNGQPIQLTALNSGGPNAVDLRPLAVRGVTGQLTPEGLWVNAVEGEAAAWGLRPGDLVRSVDGQPLTVRRDAFSLLSSLDPSRGFVFEVVRGGTRLAVPYFLGAR